MARERPADRILQAGTPLLRDARHDPYRRTLRGPERVLQPRVEVDRVSGGEPVDVAADRHLELYVEDEQWGTISSGVTPGLLQKR